MSSEDQPLTAAEEAKKLGNECFSAKKYDEAILHYTTAIKEDPENAVYYSNRSACFFSLKKWEAAGEDATSCVQKDSSFIKGYYRLALALTEQGLYDDASSTLLNACKLEPDNAQLLKQLRVVRAKKAAQAKRESAAKGPQKQLDDTQRHELQSLNEEMQKHGKDLRGVQNSMAVCAREGRSNQVTSNQILSLDASTPLFRAIGKGFYMTTQEEVQGDLQREAELLAKNAKDLANREEYLERRIAQNRSNMIEIAS